MIDYDGYNSNGLCAVNPFHASAYFVFQCRSILFHNILQHYLSIISYRFIITFCKLFNIHLEIDKLFLNSRRYISPLGFLLSE